MNSYRSRRERCGAFGTLAVRRTRSFLLSSILGLALLLLAASVGCAPASSPGDGKQSESAFSASNDLPEITEETIHKRINDTRVRQVPEENQVAEPISWSVNNTKPCD